MYIQTTLTALLAVVPFGLSLPKPDDHRALLDIIETGPCEWVRADNPDEKEWYKHMQLTETQECGTAPECQTGIAESHSFGYEVSGGASTPFVNAGFGVSESWSSEESHGCTATTGYTVCAWYKVKYLEYTVKPKGYCDPGLKQRRISAPITGEGQDHKHYCVTGKQYCRQDNDYYWQEI